MSEKDQPGGEEALKAELRQEGLRQRLPPGLLARLRPDEVIKSFKHSPYCEIKDRRFTFYSIENSRWYVFTNERLLVYDAPTRFFAGRWHWPTDPSHRKEVPCPDKKWSRPEFFGEIPYSEIYDVHENWQGDLGMHVEQRTSGSGYVSGISTNELGTLGGGSSIESYSYPVKHYVAVTLTLLFKHNDKHQSLQIAYKVDSEENLRYLRGVIKTIRELTKCPGRG